jgi:glyoxylase-like metal-dependent hydrolase (beta-lactamase superfamily II)
MTENSGSPNVTTFFNEPTYTAAHLVVDPATNAAAIFDSVLDYEAASGRTDTASADEIIAYVEKEGLTVEWIIDTHVHADHLSAAPYLKKKLGGKLAIGDRVSEVQKVFKTVFNTEPSFILDGSQFDHLFADGEPFKLGSIDSKVMHTPGHTPACATFIIGDAAFVGDTLFMPDYGSARCDFPDGDATILFHSIHKIYALAPETRMFLCHDYKAPGRDFYAWETTVGNQMTGNIHVHDDVTEAEFVHMRTERDKTLSMPALIIPSVQVNIRAGHMPPPEDNGVADLKIPVDTL